MRKRKKKPPRSSAICRRCKQRRVCKKECEKHERYAQAQIRKILILDAIRRREGTDNG